MGCRCRSGDPLLARIPDVNVSVGDPAFWSVLKLAKALVAPIRWVLVFGIPNVHVATGRRRSQTYVPPSE